MWSNGWVGKGSMFLKRIFERFVESSLALLDYGTAPLKLGLITY